MPQRRHTDSFGQRINRPPRHKTKHHGKEREVFFGPRAQEVVAPYLARTTKLDAYLFTPQLAEAERDEARRANYTPPENAGGDYRDWPSYQKRREKQQARQAEQGSHFNPYWTPRAYARRIAEVCKDHGIPHWSPNQLRHNFATRIRDEFGLETAQVTLGHANADVTQVYAERDRATAEAAIERVG
jgi:integrase